VLRILPFYDSTINIISKKASLFSFTGTVQIPLYSVGQGS
jgi:hypothetical protein